MLQWNKLVKYLNILNVIDLMWMLILPQPTKTCYLEKIIYKKESVVFYRSHDYGILQHTFEVKLLHIKHKGLWICFVKTSPLCLYVTVFITQIFHLVTMKISLLTLPRVFCKLHIFIKLELSKEFYDWCLGLWRMVGLTKMWCRIWICKHLVRYYWGPFLQQQTPTGLSVSSCPIRPSHCCPSVHALFVGSWQNNSLCWQKPYLLMDW